MDELERTPLYQKLDAVRRTIALYDAQTSAAQPSVKTSTSRPGTASSAVLAGAEDYLRLTGRREMAPGITAELHRKGIVPSTDVQTVRTVASYLSASDRFNNVRGQGYGLAEWPMNQASDEPDQTPASWPRSILPAEHCKGEMQA